MIAKPSHTANSRRVNISALSSNQIIPNAQQCNAAEPLSQLRRVSCVISSEELHLLFPRVCVYTYVCVGYKVAGLARPPTYTQQSQLPYAVLLAFDFRRSDRFPRAGKAKT